ncbi:MAG: hypothetical protein Q9188_003719 [Gyalolechia gomerana]
MAAQCSPPNYFWKAFEKDYPGRCVQVQVLYQALAWSDLVLDVLVLTVPIPVVVSLHLPWRAKIKVIDILMLNSVVLRRASLLDLCRKCNGYHRRLSAHIGSIVEQRKVEPFQSCLVYQTIQYKLE